MSKRKTDIQRLIEKYDTQIAEHQAAIENLQASKQTALDVQKERVVKAKKATAVKGVRKAVRTAQQGTGQDGKADSTLFDQAASKAA